MPLFKRSNLLIFLLYTLIAIALMAPMASSSVVLSVNDIPSHLGYTVQAGMAIKEGQFPLRVAPYEDNSWRYPAFQFYSQVPYALAGLIYTYILPGDPYLAYKIVMIASLVIGAIYIYRLSFWLTHHKIASLLAGTAYMAAPYFLINILSRGAFTEAVAQGILPIVLYYTIRCYTTGKRHYLFLSSIAWFALATTHIITFIYSSLFIGLLGLFLILGTRKTNFRLSHLIKVAIGYGLAWLLALYFLAPVILESSNLAVGQQIGSANPYGSNGLTPLANLLSPTSLPSEPTLTGTAPTYGLHPAVGWILLIAWGVVAYYYFAKASVPFRLRQTRGFILPLLGVFLIAFLMTWSPFNFWVLLPKPLWVTQFTFRILTHVTWTGALLSSYAIVLLFKGHLDRRHLVLGILIIVLANSSWLPAPRIWHNGKLTVSEVIERPLFRFSGALDYLNRSPLEKLYGNAELPLLFNSWNPGYETWNIFVDNPLLLEMDQTLPIWSTNEQPILHVQGEVPTHELLDKAKLTVFSNEEKVSETELSSPELDWRVPFENARTDSKSFRLKFEVDGPIKDDKKLRIKVNRLVFEGLSPENTVVPVTVTEENCNQKGVKKVCEISVSNDAQVVQIPVLYYPRMLKILVDGKKTEYFPTNHRSYNLVGLQLQPGTYQIVASFVGLAWANWLSGIAWLSLIIVWIRSALNLQQFSNK